MPTRVGAAIGSSEKVIISCALTGAVTAKQLCPAIPYTPVEIAEEAKRAYDAGAACVHIHARNDDGSPNFKAPRYKGLAMEVSPLARILVSYRASQPWPPKAEFDAWLKDHYRGEAKSAIVSDVLVQKLLMNPHAIVITDDYAPVDNLIAPVFEERFGYNRKGR